MRKRALLCSYLSGGTGGWSVVAALPPSPSKNRQSAKNCSWTTTLQLNFGFADEKEIVEQPGEKSAN